MFSVLEANIFQYGFLEEHKESKNGNIEKWSRDYGN